MSNKQDREEALEGIRDGLADAQEGRVQPLDVAFSELRRELGIPGDGTKF